MASSPPSSPRNRSKSRSRALSSLFTHASRPTSSGATRSPSNPASPTLANSPTLPPTPSLSNHPSAFVRRPQSSGGDGGGGSGGVGSGTNAVIPSTPTSKMTHQHAGGSGTNSAPAHSRFRGGSGPSGGGPAAVNVNPAIRSGQNAIDPTAASLSSSPSQPSGPSHPPSAFFQLPRTSTPPNPNHQQQHHTTRSASHHHQVGRSSHAATLSLDSLVRTPSTPNFSSVVMGSGNPPSTPPTPTPRRATGFGRFVSRAAGGVGQGRGEAQDQQGSSPSTLRLHTTNSGGNTSEAARGSGPTSAHPPGSFNENNRHHIKGSNSGGIHGNRNAGGGGGTGNERGTPLFRTSTAPPTASSSAQMSTLGSLMAAVTATGSALGSPPRNAGSRQISSPIGGGPIGGTTSSGNTNNHDGMVGLNPSTDSGTNSNAAGNPFVVGTAPVLPPSGSIGNGIGLNERPSSARVGNRPSTASIIPSTSSTATTSSGSSGNTIRFDTLRQGSSSQQQQSHLHVQAQSLPSSPLATVGSNTQIHNNNNNNTTPVINNNLPSHNNNNSNNDTINTSFPTTTRNNTANTIGSNTAFLFNPNTTTGQGSPSAPLAHTTSISTPSSHNVPSPSAAGIGGLLGVAGGPGGGGGGVGNAGLSSYLFHHGLMRGALSDLKLGCWGRVYRVHRIVLGQSEFFAGMLEGGWKESRIKTSHLVNNPGASGKKPRPGGGDDRRHSALDLNSKNDSRERVNTVGRVRPSTAGANENELTPRVTLKNLRVDRKGKGKESGDTPPLFPIDLAGGGGAVAADGRRIKTKSSSKSRSGGEDEEEVEVEFEVEENEEEGATSPKGSSLILTAGDEGEYEEDSQDDDEDSSADEKQDSKDEFSSAQDETDSEDHDPSLLTLHFDTHSHQITRAAFEYCLGHLYGHPPRLLLPYWARTDPSNGRPLGPAFHDLLEKQKRAEKDGKDPTDWANDEELMGGMGRKESESLNEWADVVPGNGQGHQQDTRPAHPATPQFLLSLLATATYLSIPSLVHMSLTMIQNSLTPWTICTYLRFALGHGVTGWGEGEREGGCRGLETVGVYVGGEHQHRANLLGLSQRSQASPPLASDSGDLFYGSAQERVGESCACWLARWGADVLAVEERIALSGDSRFRGTFSSSTHHQALDPALMRYPCLIRPELRVWRIGGLPPSWVRGVISSDAFFMGSEVKAPTVERPGGVPPGEILAGGGEFERYGFARRAINLRREERARSRSAVGHGVAGGHERFATAASHFNSPAQHHGFEASSISTTLSMTEDEDEDDGRKSRGSFNDESTTTAYGGRFESGMSASTTGVQYDDVPEEEEEKEYESLLESGIYYSHLPFTQLSFIARDVCPSTGRTYTPTSVVRQALWDAEELRNIIPSTVSPSFPPGTSSSNTAPNPFLPPSNGGPGASPSKGEDEKEQSGEKLGIATQLISPAADKQHSTHQSNIGDALSTLSPGTRQWYLVPVDLTVRLNDLSNTNNSTPQDGFSSTHWTRNGIHKRKGSRRLSSVRPAPPGADRFFGLGTSIRLGSVSSGVIGSPQEVALKRKVVPFQPCRFSVEFWGVGDLKERQRLYSPTIFYAGSLFNAYLQIVRKKQLQLGVYLHRQSLGDPPPAPSRPPADSSTAGSTLLNDPTLLPPRAPVPTPYVDPRNKIQTFFSIHAHNMLGSSLTNFASGPDSFAISQSWGWKSTSLRSEEYLGAGSALLGTLDPNIAAAERNAGKGGKGGKFESLRCTIVLGHV